MLFLKIFFVFSKIGIFNFGGGYAMISLLQDEIVKKNGWLTNAEFTDIVAISQSTPGPIGINSATYTGYTVAINEGYPEWVAVICAVFATLSVLWLPFLVMLYISRFLIKHSDSQHVHNVFAAIRPVIVGLIAAAAIQLMTRENFSAPSESWFAFITSVLIFCFAFVGVRLYKVNPILLLVICGFAGLIIY